FLRGRFHAGVIALMIASAFPLYSIYDWMRGASLSRQFSEVTIVEPVDRSLPVVFVTPSADLCRRICIQLLRSGAMSEFLQTGDEEFRSGGRRKSASYRIAMIPGCQPQSESVQMF